MEHFDVVVVGAGPGGSLAAKFAARNGAKTLLVDQRPELGHPVQCGEFLPTPTELKDLFDCPEVIDDSFDIPSETILRATHWMVCVSPYGRRYRFPLDGYSVSRRAFDKALAYQAEGAGAELRFPCGVTRVQDSEISFSGGTTVRAEVIIGADGPISTVARGTGFAIPREMFRMITATVEGHFADEIALYFGRVAPGGYAWVIPKESDANVGLGVARLPRGQTLSRLLEHFRQRFGLNEPFDLTRWWVPIGPPPASAVRGRALFVGDAANLVMATNGGGIPTAMISGRDAGVVAAKSVREGTSLAEYDTLLRAHLAGPLANAHRIKLLGDTIVHYNPLLALGMRYIGASGLDTMMRLRRPTRLGSAA
ncbi:MAG: geranylgeranyl reductase family protein [Thermoplasmata archaeon]